MMEDADNLLAHKLEARVERVTVETLAGIIETVDTDHNKSSVPRAF